MREKRNMLKARESATVTAAYTIVLLNVPLSQNREMEGSSAKVNKEA